MRATIIREPWIDLILSGNKTWEMRSKPTQIRGLVGLIRKGSGMVVATARVIDSPGPLDRETYARTVHLHGVPVAQQGDVIKAGWVYPWVLSDVRLLSPPVRYRHEGGVTWVTLQPDVEGEITRRLGMPASEATAPPRAATASVARSSASPASVPKPAGKAAPTPAGMTRHVQLTAGNLKNNHVYLRSILDFFPEDAIGGSSKADAADRRLRVTFEPGGVIETDIAGDKAILRGRGEVIRRFFEDSGATVGDKVEITRTSSHTYTLKLGR